MLLKKVPDAWLVPVVINGSWKMGRYGHYPLSFGERMSWTILPPVQPDGRSAEELVKEVELAVKGSLENKSL